MGGLKTTETNLDVNEIINSLPENKIKKDSMIILDLLKKLTKKQPRVWGDNFDKSHEESKHWEDAISIDLSTEEFLFWLDYKAFN